MGIFDKLPDPHKDGGNQPTQPVNTVSDEVWAKVMAAPSDRRHPGNSSAWINNFYGTAGKEALS